HQDGRILLFVGDLIDRGPDSLGVAQRVFQFHREQRALCLMGNHEYNLLAHLYGLAGFESPKDSNRATVEDVHARAAQWQDVLTWFETLPLGVALPELRVIHACWHSASLQAVEPILGRAPTPAPDHTAFAHLEAHVVLVSPFLNGQLCPGLSTREQGDAPHEVLMKGYELPTTPFRDNQGTLRDHRRVQWWKEGDGEVIADRTQVFGHYWNCPPIRGDFAPPYPSGHPKLRAWAQEIARELDGPGRVALTEMACCIDFNGLTKANRERGTPRAYVGALRWPEREVVWAG
ncbi:MAG: metallophosphoesterase, partial [Myxococcota bacterium]